MIAIVLILAAGRRWHHSSFSFRVEEVKVTSSLSRMAFFASIVTTAQLDRVGIVELTLPACLATLSSCICSNFYLPRLVARRSTESSLEDKPESLSYARDFSVRISMSLVTVASGHSGRFSDSSDMLWVVDSVSSKPPRSWPLVPF